MPVAGAQPSWCSEGCPCCNKRAIDHLQDLFGGSCGTALATTAAGTGLRNQFELESSCNRLSRLAAETWHVHNSHREASTTRARNSSIVPRVKCWGRWDEREHVRPGIRGMTRYSGNIHFLPPLKRTVRNPRRSSGKAHDNREVKRMTVSNPSTADELWRCAEGANVTNRRTRYTAATFWARRRAPVTRSPAVS